MVVDETGVDKLGCYHSMCTYSKYQGPFLKGSLDGRYTVYKVWLGWVAS